MAISEAVSTSAGDAATTSEGAAATSSGRKAAIWVATLLTLALVAGLGYTQWWVPRQEAQRVAHKVQYEHCLDDVKVYLGKHSYKSRLAQCKNFLSD